MVKRGLLALVFILMFTSLASAEIIIHNQPNAVYNLGDSSSVSMTIKSLAGATDIFYMNLICEGQEINFYMNGVSLSPGEEKRIDASLIFTKNLIGEIKGTCVIKGIFGAEHVLTNEFKLSDHISLLPDVEQTVFNPGESFLVKGNAIKENGQPANGFINLEIVSGNQSSSINQYETITDGFFSINVSIPEGMKAGKYLLKLNAHEVDFGGSQTNTGFINQNIDVSQIPTSLEIITEEEVEPGTNAQVIAVLHDQTGESIDSTAKITVKNGKSKTIEEVEQSTNEVLEIPISYNEKSSNWTVIVESNGFTTETSFLIMEKKDVNVSLVNNTVTVTNVGNVFYNDSVPIKIGSEQVFLDVALKVDETQEYKLTAPDGEYEITIVGDDGGEYKQRVTLTGNVVGAKKRKSGGFIFSFAWIFIILVLGMVAYMFFNKGHKKTFFAYMPKFLRKRERTSKITPLGKSSALRSKNPAVVSLSIRGDKQKATTVCLHIKNLKEIEGTKNNAEETLQKIINFAEEHKAITYENQNDLYFILAPTKTRTFKNESAALHIAQAAKKTLTEHNRLFKQKIESGLAINNGVIIVKPERDSTKFMSMGSFITTARKTASTSDGRILFSKEVGDKLKSEVKAEKVRGEEDIYLIKEVKKYSAENKKFVEGLVKKWDKEKKEE